MQSNYWNKVLHQRIGRRRVVLGSAATAASAAFLAACGGDDDDSSPTGSTAPASSSSGASGATGATGATGSTSGTTGATGATGGSGSTGGSSSGLVVPIQDETSSLVRGGIYKSVLGTPTTLDPHFTGPQTTHCWMCYSQLLRTKPGHLQNTSGEIDRELLESWEMSADKLTITGKLTADTHFSPIPPVDGRAVDVEDVLTSWTRYSEISPRRADLANSINPDAPVLSVTAPDERTIVIKLAKPYAPILSALSAKFNGTFYTVPKEASDPAVLDLKGTVVGSGPFYMSEWIPGTSTFFRRNPGFNMDDRDLPYIEGADFFALPDYPTVLAQFRAGNVHDTYGNFAQDDILATKADIPELEIQAGGNDSTALTGAQIRAFFGQEAGSPFVDERVRQAFVLTWDRDLFIDVDSNFEAFQAAGLPMERFYCNGLRDESWPGWHLNPLGSDFGENSKFFKPDIEEAKKLLDAAGYPDGVEHDAFTTTYSGAYTQRFESLLGMAEQSGLFHPKIEVLDFGSVWNVTFRNNKGAFSGVGFILDINELDPAVDLFTHYHPSGSKYFGSDDALNGLLESMIVEYDTDARMKLAHDIERYEGGANFQPLPGGATTFRITWPALRNKFVWQGDSQGRYLSTLWLDQKKAPFV